MPFDDYGTTALQYNYDALVTGKGQSGAAVHMLETDENDKKTVKSYRTIGVHVGNKDKHNYAAALTKKLFLDFLHPKLKELYDKYKGTGDSESAVRLGETLSEHQAAADARALERKGEDIKRQRAALDQSKATFEKRRLENEERIRKQRKEERKDDSELLEKDEKANNEDLNKLLDLLESDFDCMEYSEGSLELLTFLGKCGKRHGGHLDCKKLLRDCLLTLNRDEAKEHAGAE